MSNKLLFSLPRPTNIQVTDNTKNYTNKDWPIQTFLKEENKNVNDTIYYYYQKMLSFVKIVNAQLSQQLGQWDGVQSIEELFVQAADMYDKNVSDPWIAIQKTSTTNLQNKINELNNYTISLQAAGKQTISFASILSILTVDQYTKSVDNKIPGSINIDMFQNKLTGLTNSYQSGTPQQMGTHRALAMGELYEQGVNDMIAKCTKGVLNYFHTGNGRTTSNLTKQLPSKTDGLLTISGINFDLSEISPYLSGTLTNSDDAKNIVSLEAYDDIDLTDGGLRQAINLYINNPSAAAMIGIQNKAWVGASGTMGSFEKSANEIRNRSTWTPSGEPISKWFANDGRFANYTGYVLSKYLINIIGAYNALMVTGAHGIMPTYMWLWNLYMSGKHLRHTFNLTQSIDKIRKDHTRETLAKNERGFHDAAIYTVRNNIVIANYKPA